MPIYEYRCSDCSKKFEELVQNSVQKISCPECKSEKVEKQLSTFAASAGSTQSTPSCGGGGCGTGFG
ncbi:MAG: zinc ribbon domain-containing protein [Calditrichaeota bacterium]|nr:MAG: zinc ribbon domain-containing protein [Calditrichota bacterium]